MIASPDVPEIEPWLDAHAFMLAGQPPESIARELNGFCWQLDKDLIADLPDEAERSRAVISAAEAICRRLDEFSLHGVGRA